MAAVGRRRYRFQIRARWRHVNGNEAASPSRRFPALPHVCHSHAMSSRPPFRLVAALLVAVLTRNVPVVVSAASCSHFARVARASCMVRRPARARASSASARISLRAPPEQCLRHVCNARHVHLAHVTQVVQGGEEDVRDGVHCPGHHSCLSEQIAFCGNPDSADREEFRKSSWNASTPVPCGATAVERFGSGHASSSRSAVTPGSGAPACSTAGDTGA